MSKLYNKIWFLLFQLIVSIGFIQLVLVNNNINKAKTNEKNAKLKINNFMKDLYNTNSLEDLSKLGVSIPLKLAPAAPATGIKHSVGILGRASGNAKLGPAELNLPSPLTGAGAEEVKDATPGKCDPKPVCISNPLTLNITSTQFAFPPCINIHRCDGCCPSNEKCVAIRSHEVRLQKVGIINFDGESEPKYDETFVNVLNHTECLCKCQWENDQDCRNLNSNFIRNPYACECICPEELFCDALHEFDRESCTCKCRKDAFSSLEQKCKLRGFNWNDTSCKCEAVKTSINQKEIKVGNRG